MKQKGFILYNPFDKDFFFRVYSKEKYEPGDEAEFKDYKLCIEDLHIEIDDEFVVLEDGIDEEMGKLCYSDKTLGKPEKTTDNTIIKDNNI